jgi:Spy/CpxP family protein refolding chaperone
MKNPILLTLLLIVLLAVSASAQDNPPPPEGERMPPPQGPNGPPPDDRGEILRQLNLTQEQFRAIRKLLGDNGPKVREAQMDFRDAQEELDEAIYADNVDEARVQSLTKRSADAQATLMRLRTANEFAIRRVLTPEQVTKFRELRKEQILKKRMQERIRQQRQNDGQGPNGRPPMGQPQDRPPMGQPQGQPPLQRPNQQPARQPGNISGPKRKPVF